MKTKTFVNKLLSSLFIMLSTMSLTFELMACDPSFTNAQRGLEGLLNREEGQKMTADELANMSRNSGDKIRGAGVDIHLPITSVDTRPIEGATYMCEDSTSLVFSFEGAPDTLRTIGTVNIEWHQNIWGESRDMGNKPNVNTYYVQSRGKGIYTLWFMDQQFESGHPVLDENGDTIEAPHFEGMLIFVYPKADSLLITRGHKDTEHTYKLNR